MLSPGTSVYVPMGLHHATVSEGPGPLELVSGSPAGGPRFVRGKGGATQGGAVTVVQAGTGNLEATARQARREIIIAVAHAKAGHLGGPLSATTFSLLSTSEFSIFVQRT